MAQVTVFHTGSAGTWVAAQFTKNDGTASGTYPGEDTGDILILDGRMGGAITGQPANLTKTLARITQYASAPYAFGTATTPIDIAPVLLELGVPSPDGANLSPAPFSINLENGPSAVTIHATAQVGTNNVAPCLIRGANNFTADVVGPNCKVGIGMNMPNTVAQCTSLRVSEDARSSRIEIGAGNTGLVTVYADEGETILNCNVTTIYVGKNATVRTEGAGTVGTAYVSGMFIPNSTGTLSVLHVEDGGTADFTQTNNLRAVSQASVQGTGQIKANAKFVTWPTAGVQCLRGAHTSQVDFGENRYVVSTAAGEATLIEAHTANDTLTANETGTTHTNLGAAGTIAITLPVSPPTGTWFRFIVETAQILQIEPGAAQAFYVNDAKLTDEKYIAADDEGESIFVIFDGADWATAHKSGTWTVEA